jgi:hypothetical protein
MNGLHPAPLKKGQAEDWNAGVQQQILKLTDDMYIRHK